MNLIGCEELKDKNGAAAPDACRMSRSRRLLRRLLSFDAIGMGDVQGALWTRTKFLPRTSNLPLDTIDVGGHREEIEGRR